MAGPMSRADQPRGRFLVLYYPAPRRRWPGFWRQTWPPPTRLGLGRDQEEAEHLAARFLSRRQRGFRWPAAAGLEAVWGWDDREIGWHGECDTTCGCAGPGPDREFVLIAEFEDEAAARRPDVRLEREAWLTRLTVEQAVALTWCRSPAGCFPPCAHHAALVEEVDAAWQWRARHQREVRAHLRSRRAAVAAERPAW